MSSRSVRVTSDIMKAKIIPTNKPVPPPIFPRTMKMIASTKAAIRNGSDIRKKNAG